MRRPKRLFSPILAALLLSAAFAGGVSAETWNSTCGSGELCIYYDWHWQGPIAAISGSNASYVGENYPGISWTVNDTASSTKNLYSSRDVVWFQGTSYTGTPNQCVNPGTGMWEVGWVLNDTFSSHLVAIDNRAC